MKKIIDYTYVARIDSEFLLRVKELIKEGWQPIGSISPIKICVDNLGEISETSLPGFIQAMVKYED